MAVEVCKVAIRTVCSGKFGRLCRGVKRYFPVRRVLLWRSS